MEELRKKLMEELKNKLGEGYEVSPVDVNKNNGTILHGISIMLKGNIGGPTVYVDNFYQRFQGTNEEIEEMIDYILDVCMWQGSDRWNAGTDYKGEGIKYPNLPGSGRQNGSDYYHVCRTGEKICVRKERYQKYLYAHLVMRSQKKMQKRNMSSASTTKECSEEESLSAVLFNTLLLRLITQICRMRSSGRAYKNQWLSPVISS